MLRGMIAQLLNMPVDNVQVVVYEAAGCYGRNGADLVAADAASMSRLTGRPVRVQWMRWDEHGWDPKGTACATIGSCMFSVTTPCIFSVTRQGTL
jgi:nicotinate dehydrogenase subunit B